MRTTLLTLILAAFALAQTPLTNEEKLAFENASLKLQLLKVQEADIQKQAQAVFESACKRAGIDLAACKYDPQSQSVKKEEVKK